MPLRGQLQTLLILTLGLPGASGGGRLGSFREGWQEPDVARRGRSWRSKSRSSRILSRLIHIREPELAAGGGRRPALKNSVRSGRDVSRCHLEARSDSRNLAEFDPTLLPQTRPEDEARLGFRCFAQIISVLTSRSSDSSDKYQIECVYAAVHHPGDCIIILLVEPRLPNWRESG